MRQSKPASHDKFSPKKSGGSFIVDREYARSCEVAGWLDVLWHIYGMYHLAPSSHPGRQQQEVFRTQDFPHTPLIWVTPVALPPRAAIGLSFWQEMPMSG